MLEMRPNCEACDKDLAPDAQEAYICSFECTFCFSCANERFNSICPNCGGGLVCRPTRSGAQLENYPASAKRVTKAHT